MRRTHVHVSDSGSVWIIHEDPYNLEKDEDLENEKSPSSENDPSAPCVHLALHTKGQEDETTNLDGSSQNEPKSY